MDKALVDGLKLAKNKPCFFALITKGADGKLLVGQKQPSAKDIADAKKEIGGTTVVSGRCLFEAGAYVFETARESPAALSAVVKKVIQKDAGMSIRAEFRVAGAEGAESEAEE